MRIVDKQTFMSLPRHTVYAETDGVQGPLVGELCIKGANFGKSDFYYTPVNNIKPVDSNDSVIPAFDMMSINPDIEFPGLMVEERHGHLSDDAKFIVYDRHEINQLINMLQKAVKKLDKKSQNTEEQ